MMQDSLRNTIDAYADIIEGVEDLEISQKNVVSRLKVKLRVFDGSMLWVREVWVNGEMAAYSYYWLRSGVEFPDGNGWIPSELGMIPFGKDEFLWNWDDKKGTIA